MDPLPVPKLKPDLTRGSLATRAEQGVWHLEIPAGPKRRYRLAQIEDYTSLRRKDYPWQAPLHLSLRARASSVEIPGTWGFGLWNDPYGMSLFPDIRLFSLPALPNAAWFFFASPHNYLSFRDDLPAHGALAATFRSPHWSGLQTALSAHALPFLVFPPSARFYRQLAQRFIQEDSTDLAVDPRLWHTYEISWKTDSVAYQVDGIIVLETKVSPLGPLGLVIWVDNQYAAFPPDGRITWGALENPIPAWIEVTDIRLASLPVA